MRPDTDCILHVALPIGQGRLFDYRLPEQDGQTAHNRPALQPGIRVRVPFRRRELTGLVVSLGASPDSSRRLRPALAVLDTSPLLPESLLQLTLWSADYYHYDLGPLLLQSLPALLRAGQSTARPPCTIWRAQHNAAAGKTLADSRAEKQKAVWATLCAQPEGIADDALKAAGIERPLLRQLVRRGLAEQISTTAPSTPFDSYTPLLKNPPLTLNSQQQSALDAMVSRPPGFSVTLLQGITGSGKTEVYLQAIERALTAGTQTLVMVPEINLTPQMLARFQARFHTPVAVLHSGLSERQRLHNWLAAQRGEAGIVLATRSGIFVPLPQPGLIIVDEEHDLSYKQQERGARLCARNLALVRGKLESVPVLLGSATPCLESLHNAGSRRFYHEKLGQRAGAAREPELVVIDTRRQQLEGGLTATSLNAMHHCLARGEQVLVFLNRRGYAPTVICDDCGGLVDCPACDARLTVHKRPPELRCHHCDHRQPLPDRCPACASPRLCPTGIGTERTEDILARHFHATEILRVDRDSMSRKGAFTAVMDKIKTGKPAILLGTQMLTKGHHFPAVTLVVIVNADAGLFSADFRGPERTGQMILQVAGRAGRGDRQGKVLIQTANPGNSLLQTLITQGYDAFARHLLEQRRSLSLPPFAHLALISAEAPELTAVTRFLADSAALARQLASPDSEDPAVLVTGPLPAPLERRQGRLRWQLHLRSASRAALHQLLRPLVARMRAQPPVNGLRWAVDVDPQEMG